MNRTYFLKLITLIIFFNVSFNELNAQSNNLVFNTDGLYYAEFYDYIFRGHFEKIKFSRKDDQFSLIMNQYLKNFGKQCSDYLPSNKVEIMKLVCSREKVTKNGYGTVISRDCVDWEWIGTGLFAKPDLYNAKQVADNVDTEEGLQKALSMLTDPNAAENSIDFAHKINGVRNDMSEIFKLNSCNSEGVKRFEENLKLFALGKPSIRMKEESKYTTIKKSGGPKGEQNYIKLFDDLIANQSKTWMMNRYKNGSISNLVVLTKDENGRPTSLRANFRYSTSFGGSYKGWAEIYFVNGLPDCIYFHDFPEKCKKPNSSIVASFSQGKYSK